MFNTFTVFDVLNYISDCMDDVLSKKAKKLVHWHDNYVVFVTPEAKQLGWNDKTIVTVSLVEENGEKKIVIEKGMQL